MHRHQCRASSETRSRGSAGAGQSRREVWRSARCSITRVTFISPALFDHLSRCRLRAFCRQVENVRQCVERDVVVHLRVSRCASTRHRRASRSPQSVPSRCSLTFAHAPTLCSLTALSRTVPPPSTLAFWCSSSPCSNSLTSLARTMYSSNIFLSITLRCGARFE